MTKNKDSGSVYILSNNAMPGILKIGHTTRMVEERAEELSKQTGVPEKFVVEYDWLVENPEQYERLIHANLKKYRISEDKEFFRIEKDLAQKACQRIIRGSELIDFAQEMEMLVYIARKHKALDEKGKKIIDYLETILKNEGYQVRDAEK